VLLYPARRLWTLALSLAGIVLIAFDLAQRSLPDAAPVIVVVAWTALGLWLTGLLLPETWVRTRAAVALATIVTGSLAAVPTDVVGYVPAVVALLTLAGTPVFAPVLAGAGAVGSLLLIWAGALSGPSDRGTIAGAATLLLIAGLGGLSRRQYRVSEARARALLEERAQVAGLTERSRIARDLHDVLAHSLGGLVVQLEAVDALLEAGRVGDARDRVRGARSLAVTGLDEARRAVNALREPEEPLSATVAALAGTHREIGGHVAVRGDADRGVLGRDGQVAVRRAVQELLTNARRHAPGAPTTLDLDWDGDMLTITASTPAGHLPAPAGPAPAGPAPAGPAPASAPVGPASGDRSLAVPASGGGHGLAGMRERVIEAGGTMTVRDGPPFEVVLRVPGERAG
jgi:signal transduction histidine kinase